MGCKHLLLVSTQIWSFTEVIRAAPFIAGSQDAGPRDVVKAGDSVARSHCKEGFMQCLGLVLLSFCLFHLQPRTWYTVVIPFLHRVFGSHPRLESVSTTLLMLQPLLKNSLISTGQGASPPPNRVSTCSMSDNCAFKYHHA